MQQLPSTNVQLTILLRATVGLSGLWSVQGVRRCQNARPNFISPYVADSSSHSRDGDQVAVVHLPLLILPDSLSAASGEPANVQSYSVILQLEYQSLEDPDLILG